MPPRKNADGRWEFQTWSPRNSLGQKRRLYVVCPPSYNTPAFARDMMRAEIERHMGLLPKRATTFGAFVRERFLVEYTAARNLRPSSRKLLALFLEKIAAPELGALPLSAVDPAAVARVCGRLQAEIRPARHWVGRNKAHMTAARRRYSDRTIRHVVIAVISVLRWAKKTGEIATVPEIVIPKVAEAQRPAPYTNDEARKIISAARDEEERLLFLLNFDAGLRKSESLGLQWSQIDFDHHDMVIDRKRYRGREEVTKGGRARRVPMTSALERTLRAFHHLRGPHVLCDLDGNPRDEQWVRTVKTRAERAGNLRPVRWHDGRHHFSTRATDGGVHVFGLRELLGHRDVRTTQGYVHTTTAHLASVLDVEKGRAS